MSLRQNLQVLRPSDEDPTAQTVYEFIVTKSWIELREARKISIPDSSFLWTWGLPTQESHLLLLALEEAIRDLETALNVFRLQINHLEPLSRSGKPQAHVRGVLHAVLAGMRQNATLGYSRELAKASVSSVTKVRVRVVGITREVAQIAAAREAGHPAVQ